jgi:hypothetical protein
MDSEPELMGATRGIWTKLMMKYWGTELELIAVHDL